MRKTFDAKILTTGLTRVVTVAAAMALVGAVAAQEWRTFQGDPSRQGRSTPEPTQVLPETSWNNVGRAFLRWWDPIFQEGGTIDNDRIAQTSSTGTWIDPFPAGLVNPNPPRLASFYILNNFLDPWYRVAVTSTSTASTVTNPTAGATAVYTWRIEGLQPGAEYTVEANILAGSTNIQPDAGVGPVDIRFQARYFVYEITDNNGTNTVIVDTFTQPGGFANLGQRTNNSPITFVAGNGPTNNGQITVRLYNTIVRDNFGNPLDTTAQPGNDVVYADAVRAVGNTVRDGRYVASPVVGQLQNAAPVVPSTVSNRRVYAARNETATVGATGRTYNIGALSSFIYNGGLANVAQPLRRNMVWSWPAARPNDLTLAESDRYAADRQAWLTGGPAAAPRTQHRVQLDNLSAGTSFSGTFATGNTFTGVGPNYLAAPASAAATGNVIWRGDLPEGRYTLQVFLPSDDLPADLAQNVTYTLRRNGVAIDTFVLNQSSFNGWVALPGQDAEGYLHTEAEPLTLELTNQSTSPSTRQVYADAVRFIKDADLSINSTPILASNVPILDGGLVNRDVVVVARENGRLYCLDAHGNVGTGLTQRVYWTYPTENPAGDPNAAAAADGGIAEVPSGFDLSSGVVIDVAGQSVLVIGAENGRVYAINMAGRGDGSAERRWTYPDDYNRSTPNGQMGSTTLGRIRGVAATTIAGNPAIIVTTENGQVIALDADGNPAAGTTTAVWQYAPVAPNLIGQIDAPPMVAGGQVFVLARDGAAPANGRIHALDLNTGTLNWARAVRQNGTTPFNAFGAASGVYVPAALNPTLGDTLFVMDGAGYLAALNPVNGDFRWDDNTTASGPVGSLAFTHLRTENAAGTLIVNAVPTVLVATSTGVLRGFFADGSVTTSGERTNWGFFLEGDEQQASFAVGGWPNAPGVLAERSHLYIGDSDGILYAFSSEDDNNSIPPITPGTPPGSPTANPNDPNQAELNAMIEQDDVLLVSPQTFADLQLRARNGTLSYADITAAQTTPINRRAFEYGETLYVVVTDINSPSRAQTAGYFVEAQMTNAGTGTRPFVLPVFPVTGAPSDQEGGIALLSAQVLPSGPSALLPGEVRVRVRARAASGVRGNDVPIRTGAGLGAPAADIRVANPLAVGFTNTGGTTYNRSGFTLDPSVTTVAGNSPLGLDGVDGNGLRVRQTWESGFGLPATATQVPNAILGPDPNNRTPVSNGQTGQARMVVSDRSLMTLVFGNNRGLTGVRVNARDLSHQPITDPTSWPADPLDVRIRRQYDPVTDLGIFKPLNVGRNKTNWRYREFEDYPAAFPNPSVDYPDLARTGLTMVKELFGTSEDPLFNGVTLRAPQIGATALSTYNTPAGYETGLVRTLVDTQFNVNWSVPRFQPGTLTRTGTLPPQYVGRQTIYVDSGSPGLDNNDIARQTLMSMDIRPESRLSTTTPTVDLGSQPAGAGFAGLVGNLPVTNPRDPLSTVKPSNPAWNSGQQAMFQPFTVFNDGNTNLLNVRVAKGFQKFSGSSILPVARVLELFMPGMHEMAWLDGSRYLITELDPDMSPTFGSGFDPDGQIILQKARPGDVGPTRLSTNPRRRANAFLRVDSGFLLSTTAFPPSDPRIGVATPIGTPVGQYIRQIFAFEDDAGSNGTVTVPVLGPYGTSLNPINEAFIDPGITLQFTVREARLTNRETTKAAPNVERLVAGTENFAWGNQQPAIMRTRQVGPNNLSDLLIAWTSERPEWVPVAKIDADTRQTRQQRIFLTSLSNPNVPAGAVGDTPMDDLAAWVNATAGRWFHHRLIIPAPGTEAGLFPLRPGEFLLTAEGFRFHSPAWVYNGSTDPTTDPLAIRPTRTAQVLSFIGEAVVGDAGGARRRVSHHFVARLAPDGSGGYTIQSIVVVPGERDASRSRAAIVGTLSNLSLFSITRTGGQPQLTVAPVPASPASPPATSQSLGLGSQFESLSGVSVVLRRFRNLENERAADVFFTGKVRGRANSEAFMGQLRLSQLELLPLGDPEFPWRIFEDRVDRLDFDTATGLFWSPGLDWRLQQRDLDNFDLFMRLADGTVRDLVDRTRIGEAVVDRETREITFFSRAGGQIFVDARRGTIRMSGTVIPRGAEVFLQYSPAFIRVSGATGGIPVTWTDPNGNNRFIAAGGNRARAANYTGVSTVFDERLLGVELQPDPARQDQNLTEDARFWRDSNGFIPALNAPIRHDRFFLAFTRTSTDGTSGARPFLSTMRFGVQLPGPIAMNSVGNPVTLGVTTSAIATSEPVYYHIDPNQGRIYFPSVAEGQLVDVTYRVARADGSAGAVITQTLRVGPIFETAEVAIPIEQVASETDLQIFLDPFGLRNVDRRRPPLLWMAWTSTRSGQPDVYFQTYAPKVTPIVLNSGN